jgi:hypothetical protein
MSATTQTQAIEAGIGAAVLHLLLPWWVLTMAKVPVREEHADPAPGHRA